MDTDLIDAFSHKVEVDIEKNEHPSIFPSEENGDGGYEGLHETLTFFASTNEEGEVFIYTYIDKVDSQAMPINLCQSLCEELAAEFEKYTNLKLESQQPVWTDWDNGKLFFNFDLVK